MNYTYNFIGSINNESISNFLTFVKNSKDISSLTVNINSLGGEVSCAIAIYNYLKSKEISIQTHNIGDVSSAAIILYLSGTKRTAEEACKFLIHPIALNVNSTINYNGASELLNTIVTDIVNYSAIVKKETSNMNNKYNIECLLKDESIFLYKQDAYECGIVTDM